MLAFSLLPPHPPCTHTQHNPGVGFTNGLVGVLDSLTLEDVCNPFRYSRDAVTQIVFSHDSTFMATAVSTKLLKLQLVTCDSHVTCLCIYHRTWTCVCHCTLPSRWMISHGSSLPDTEHTTRRSKVSWHWLWYPVLAPVQDMIIGITALKDLMFGIKLDSSAPRLLSISSDRTIVGLLTHIALCTCQVFLCLNSCNLGGVWLVQ